MNYALTALFLALLGFAAAGQAWRLTAVLLLAALVWLARWKWSAPRRRALTDAAAILVAAVLVWQLSCGNFRWADPVLFPAPEKVLQVFWEELPDMLRGLVSSLILLFSGYFLALATAIPAGLAAGYSRRMREAVQPYTKVLGAVPPIVYIPYAIALLPTFRLASIFVIFIGAFWPVFINTLDGVLNISPGVIDAAKTLNLGRFTFFRKVILPAALPSILTGASLAVVFSFLLLTAAELIGATSGLGWYVKNFSDFADFERVIAGILFIGLVITALTYLTGRVEKRLLRYREVNHD